MATSTIESAVYSFEGLLPDLDSPPIAARRALDHAGFRVSADGWRSLPLDDRQKTTLAGVADRVDVELVANLLRRANPAAQRISAAGDPDPSAPPEALAKALEPGRAIDPKRWARLRALDRYALAHAYRRAVARSAFSILGDAFDAVVAATAPSSGDAGRDSQPALNDPVTPTRGASLVPPASPAPAAPAATRPSDPAPARQSDPGPISYGGATRPYGLQPAGYYSSLVTPPETRDAVPQQGRTTYAYGTRPDTETDASSKAARRPSTNPPSAAISNHLNQAGEVHMVDVARKPKTERRAIARGSVLMRPETVSRLIGRDAPKGEVLATARIAAIMAAKRTHELIPLCHAVALTHLEILVETDAAAGRVMVTAVADAYDRTGCEMEAMIAVTTGCLTIYDMLKGIDRDMVVTDVKLLEKSGGRSGHYKRREGKP